MQRRNMDAPVESSCLELADVVQKTRVRLGLNNKPAAALPVAVSWLVEEADADIEELLKQDER